MAPQRHPGSRPPRGGGAPPPPPPPGGGRGGGGRHHHGGGGGRGPATTHQRQIADALTALQGAFITGGVKNPNTAMLFAKRVLSRPGVAIEPGGRVHYKGTTFNAADFATSKLGKLVTGATARARNEAAIKNDPTYRENEAAAALQRDQLAASLADARRQALIDFGDPTLVSGDAGTAAAADANQFSTRNLLAQADVANRHNVMQGANAAGTLFGGGVQSGIGEANRVQAAQVQDAYSKIRALLSASDLQGAQSGQQYDLAVKNSLIEATQRLLATGAIHAARAPNWRIKGYQFWHAPRGAGGGGGGGGGRQQQGVGSGYVSPPTQTHYPIPRPPTPVGL